MSNEALFAALEQAIPGFLVKEILHENPRFICVTTDSVKVEQLNLQLQQRGLVLC